MLDRYTHREPRLQKNLFAPGPHRIQVKATKHKSSILDKFSFSLSHLRYQIKYKINYKKKLAAPRGTTNLIFDLDPIASVEAPG